MKKITFLSVAVLLTINSVFAIVNESNVPQNVQKQMAFDTYVRLSPNEIESRTGQKLSFFEKVGLKALQFKLKKTLVRNSADCSKIVMKDGDVIEANIIQISPTEIKYKRCNKPNDPELVINKKDVLSVKTADGEIIFRNTEKNDNRDNNYGTNPDPKASSNEPKTEGNALAGMICGIAGLVLSFSIIGLAAGIVGVVLSIIGRKKINADPKRYKGKGLAMAGMICGIVACALYAIFLLAAAGA